MHNVFNLGDRLACKTGLVFTLVNKAPHVRRDGTPTELLTWRSVCRREDCNNTFEVKTGTVVDAAKNLNVVHCTEHRLTMAQVGALAGQRAKERAAKAQAARELRKQARAAERERIKAERQAAKEAARQAAREQRAPRGYHRRKLSDEDVCEIRKLSAQGFSSGDLAMVYPVSSSAIRNILTGNRRA